MSDDSPLRETPAEAVLRARLEQRHVAPWSRIGRIALSWVIMALGGGAGDEVMPGLQLVVTRKDTGAEVLRVPAGTPQEADRLLAHTRRDLSELTVTQFALQWRTAN